MLNFRPTLIALEARYTPADLDPLVLDLDPSLDCIVLAPPNPADPTSDLEPLAPPPVGGYGPPPAPDPVVTLGSIIGVAAAATWMQPLPYDPSLDAGPAIWY